MQEQETEQEKDGLYSCREFAADLLKLLKMNVTLD